MLVQILQNMQWTGIYKYGQRTIMYGVHHPISTSSIARVPHTGPPLHPESITKTLHINRPALLNPPASQESDLGNCSCDSSSELKSRAGSTYIVLHGGITHGPVCMLLWAIPGFFVLTCGPHLNSISPVKGIVPFLSTCSLYLRYIYKVLRTRFANRISAFPLSSSDIPQSNPVPATAIIPFLLSIPSALVA